MIEIPLRMWRVVEAEPDGCTCWFDPSREQLKLYELEPGDFPGVGERCEGDDQECAPVAPDQLTLPGIDDPGLPF